MASISSEEIYNYDLFRIAREIHARINNQILILTETYPSATHVQLLMNSQELSDSNKSHLNKLLNMLAITEPNGKRGLDVEITYSDKPMGPTSLHGRRYTGKLGALQGVAGWIRAELLFGSCIDLDISKAYPSIYVNLCHVIRMDCPCIRAVALNWDSILPELILQLNETCLSAYRGVERDKRVKEEVHGIINGRNYLEASRDGTQQPIFDKKVPFLENLRTELRTLSNIMKTIPPFDQMYADLKKERQRLKKENSKTIYNIEGKFVSYFSQYFERIIIDTCRVFLAHEDRKVMAIIHDGLIVQESDKNPLDLQILNKYISDKTDFHIRFTKKPLLMKKRLTPEKHPTCRPTRHLFKGAEVIRYKPWEDNDYFVKPLVFPEGIRILLIDAAMGMGKTTIVKQFLQELPRTASILGVACRIRQTKDLKSKLNMGDYLTDLGFETYLDDELVGKKALSSHPRLIIQYESLWKLSGENEEGSSRTYDYIVIDEIRSVLDQVVSVTNRERFTRNDKIFRKYLKRSKIIAMDADLHYDDAVVGFLKKWEHECHRLVYTHQPLKRTVNYTPEHVWWNLLETSIRLGNRVAALFSHKQTLKAFLMKLKELPGFDMRSCAAWYSDDVASGSSDYPTPMPDDVNEYIGLNNIQVVMFTSKITVGTDILEPFDGVYFHAPNVDTHATICPRVCFQMMGRFRVIRSSNIFLTIPDQSYFTYLLRCIDNISEDDGDEWIQNQDDVCRELTTRQDIVVDQYPTFNTQPDHIIHLNRVIAKEKKQHFLSGCITQTNNHGWLNHVKIPDTKINNSKENRKTIRKNQSEIQKMDDEKIENIMLHICQLDDQQYNEKYRYLSSGILKSPDEDIEFKTMLYMSRFRDLRNLLPKDAKKLRHMVDKKIPIEALALLKFGMENAIVVKYLNNLFSGTFRKHVATPSAAVFIFHWFLIDKLGIPEGLNSLSNGPDASLIIHKASLKLDDLAILTKLFWTAGFGPTHQNIRRYEKVENIKRPARYVNSICKAIGLCTRNGKYVNTPDRAEMVIFINPIYLDLYRAFIEEEDTLKLRANLFIEQNTSIVNDQLVLCPPKV